MMLSVNDLQKLEGQSLSGIVKVREEIHIALQPFFLCNVQFGIISYLNNQLNRWHPKLGGILVGYSDIKVKKSMNENTDHDVSPVHLDIFSDFWVFRPKVGKHLKGIVAKKTASKVSCLVHDIFNVECHRPSGLEPGSRWFGETVSVGKSVCVTVIQNDLSQRIPFILGDLFDQDIDDDDESAHQMVKKIVMVDVEDWPHVLSQVRTKNGKFQDDVDSGIDQKLHRKRKHVTGSHETETEPPNQDEERDRGRSKKKKVREKEKVIEREAVVDEAPEDKKEKKKKKKEKEKERQTEDEEALTEVAADQAADEKERKKKKKKDKESERETESETLENPFVNQTERDEKEEGRKKRKRVKSSVEERMPEDGEQSRRNQSFLEEGEADKDETRKNNEAEESNVAAARDKLVKSIEINFGIKTKANTTSKEVETTAKKVSNNISKNVSKSISKNVSNNVAKSVSNNVVASKSQQSSPSKQQRLKIVSQEFCQTPSSSSGDEEENKRQLLLSAAMSSITPSKAKKVKNKGRSKGVEKAEIPTTLSSNQTSSQIDLAPSFSVPTSTPGPKAVDKKETADFLISGMMAKYAKKSKKSK